MSSERIPHRLTRRSALLGLLGLGGCGFTPVFGTNGAAQALQGQVVVIAPETLSGFAFRRAVSDRLGAATNGQYKLQVALTEVTQIAAVTEDGDTTRFDLNGQADWTLTQGGQIIAQDSARSFTSYSATGSTVATQTAARDASDRLARALADIVMADMILAVAL